MAALGDVSSVQKFPSPLGEMELSIAALLKEWADALLLFPSPLGEMELSIVHCR